MAEPGYHRPLAQIPAESRIPEPDSSVRSPRRQPAFRVLAPVIGSRPPTGLTLGVNGNMALFEGTHISSMAGGFGVSQKKKQVLSNVRFSIFTDATAGSCRATTGRIGR